MWEFVAREEPWSDMLNDQARDAVCDGQILDCPVVVKGDTIDETALKALYKTMKSCWSVPVSNRPDFETIRDQLEIIDERMASSESASEGSQSDNDTPKLSEGAAAAYYATRYGNPSAHYASAPLPDETS
jgi:Protein tyrosine and serine/threonine kinase